LFSLYLIAYCNFSSW